MRVHRPHRLLHLATAAACILLSACSSMRGTQYAERHRDSESKPSQVMGQGPMMREEQTMGGSAMMGQGQSAPGQGPAMPPIAQMRVMPADPALLCAMHAQVASARTPEERREKMNSLFHGMPPDMQEQYFRTMQPQCQSRRMTQ